MNAAHHFARQLYERCGKSLAPKVMPRPSEWSRTSIRLSSDESAGFPGPYRPEWKPFLQDVLDAKFDHPDKLGVIIMKPSQVGVTRAVMNYVLCRAVHRPVPMMYMLDTRDKGMDKADESLRASIQDNADIAHALGLDQSYGGYGGGGRKGGRKKTAWAGKARPRRQLMNSIKFTGGRIDIVGGGSVGPVISNPYPVCFLDEYDAIERNFPGDQTGSLWTLAKGRMAATPHLAELWAFSHPTTWDKGIAERYMSQSDQRIWMFDCPRCSTAIAPLWKHVRYQIDEQTSRMIPETAKFVCPHCASEVTDAQRARAVQRRGSTVGASGRFQTQLPQADASRRAYLGLWIHRLADPAITVLELANQLASCMSERDVRGFYNTILGEPYQQAHGVVDAAAIEDAMKLDGTRGGDSAIMLKGRCLTTASDGTIVRSPGVVLVAAGVDVQKSRRQDGAPVLVLNCLAFNTRGNAWTVCCKAISGWDALAHELESFAVPIVHDDGTEEALGIDWVGIDAAYLTGQALAFCRRRLVSAMGSTIGLVAMRNAPELKRDQPAMNAPERKRIDPAREELGLVDYVYLQRHYWVDRHLRRVIERRLSRACSLPREWAEHYTSQMLVVTQTNEWAKAQEHWEAQRRDDYLMAGVYAEAVAALRAKLDRLGEFADTVAGQAPSRPLAELRAEDGAGGGGGRGAARGIDPPTGDWIRRW
jgi:hypothetical protein